VRARRTRVATGIYVDVHGYSVMVQRGGARVERRFPLGTPLEELRTTRRGLIGELEEGREVRRARLGTLAADVATCLGTLPAGKHRDGAAVLLDHWLQAPIVVDGAATTFGAVPRHALTPVQIRTQLATFLSTTHPDGRRRFAPKTVKELRRLLAWVYVTLDGADGRNPVRAVKAPRVVYDDSRGIDYPILERIFAAMPDRGRPQDGPAGGSRRGARRRPTVSLSKIRMRVMAYTGLHQVELARLRPRDVDLAQRRLWIHPRRKGSGSRGAWHRLTTPAVQALRAFVAANAFGPFDARSMARVWRHAVTAARDAWETEHADQAEPPPWPVADDARPYDLRHSVGTATYLATGDIRAAQAILRHRQLSTTERYMQAGISARAEAARDALERAWAALPQSPSTRAGHSVPDRPPVTTKRAAAKAALAPRRRAKTVNVRGG